MLARRVGLVEALVEVVVAVGLGVAEGVRFVEDGLPGVVVVGRDRGLGVGWVRDALIGVAGVVVEGAVVARVLVRGDDAWGGG